MDFHAMWIQGFPIASSMPLLQANLGDVEEKQEPQVEPQVEYD
jgi:hypothetical protein